MKKTYIKRKQNKRRRKTRKLKGGMFGWFTKKDDVPISGAGNTGAGAVNTGAAKANIASNAAKANIASNAAKTANAGKMANSANAGKSPIVTNTGTSKTWRNFLPWS